MKLQQKTLNDDMIHFKTFTLALLCAVMLVSIASAAIVPIEVTGNQTTINHGDSFTIAFKLSNTGTAPVTSASVSLPSIAAGQWTSLKVGDSAAVSNPSSPAQLLSAPLAAGANSSVITLTFTSTRSLASAGTYNSPAITFAAADASGTVATTPVTYSITINPSSTLSLASAGTVSATQNATLNVTNTGNVLFSAATNNRVALSPSGDFALQLSETSFDLSAGQSRQMSVSLAPTVDLNTLRFGTNTATVTATAGNVTAATTFTIRKTFCSAGEKGTNLTINQIDVTSTGDDDDEWKPLDRITVEVEVENNGDEDLDDVVVELGLFDNAGKKVIGDLDFDNADDEKITLDKLNDNDEDTVTFTFLVPGDFDSGSYKLTVKAYSKDVGESNLCTDTSSDLDNSFFHDIRVEREEEEGKFIGFSDSRVSPTEATCGDTVTFATDVYNIGEDDEDRVKVKIANRELDVDMSQEIRNMDIGDRKQVQFTFVVPQVADKTYFLELTSEYDYRSGNYHEFSDEAFKFPLKVIGCSVVPTNVSTSDIAISASLESDAKAGKEMVVKTTLRNRGTQAVTAVVVAKGYDDWAKLDRISERLVQLAPGESKEITLTFTVDADAKGEQSFILEIGSGSRVQTQEVAVTIEESAGLQGLSTNKLAWIIGIINVILIIIIIIVAVKISRR